MTMDALGLALNVAGAFIVIWLGVPLMQYTQDGTLKLPRTFLIRAKHGKFRYWLSKVGLGLLPVGFGLQLASELLR